MDQNETTQSTRPIAKKLTDRTTVFISKATPGDDEFVLWLAPRLEAEGYTVFADILSLEGGSRWRKEVTSTLQVRSAKMLLCCRDSTLASDGVQEEIGIASDLAKELNDPKFIIPLRIEKYKKLFGIGELQWVDFVRGWAEGLVGLLETLKRQKVPRDISKIQINPNWEIYRRRRAVPLRNEPERLTSNWLRVIRIPGGIRYFEAIGAADYAAIAAACRGTPFPVELHSKGFLSFANESEINEALAHVGRFEAKHEVETLAFVQHGSKECGILRQDASNTASSMFRQAWNRYCRNKGFLEYQYSKDAGFHASRDQAEIGQRFPWGRQGEKRSSMLRNAARGYVWNFGVTAFPAFWPFPHFKLKARVLFSHLYDEEAGDVLEDAMKQHRLRRSVCKSWRNKQWHGRIMAFIELLSGDSSYIDLPLGPSAAVKLEAAPILFVSPVSTYLPNTMQDEDEEQDTSTLGRPDPEEEP